MPEVLRGSEILQFSEQTDSCYFWDREGDSNGARAPAVRKVPSSLPPNISTAATQGAGGGAGGRAGARPRPRHALLRPHPPPRAASHLARWHRSPCAVRETMGPDGPRGPPVCLERSWQDMRAPRSSSPPSGTRHLVSKEQGVLEKGGAGRRKNCACSVTRGEPVVGGA